MIPKESAFNMGLNDLEIATDETGKFFIVEEATDAFVAGPFETFEEAQAVYPDWSFFTRCKP